MLTVDGYKIWFKHHIYNERELPFTYHRGETYCYIEHGEEPISIEVAFCSKDDQFHKPTGRKVALTRAIKNFDKEFRTKIWKAYWNKIKGVYNA